jgi:MFS transporter, putative metabolite:H+ symporter
MAGGSSDDLLALFDSAPLNRRYWVTFALMSAVFVFDFFDFLVVGYLLAAVAREWQLTYGESAVILYSGGVGAIVGALVFGRLGAQATDGHRYPNLRDQRGADCFHT